MSRQVGGMQAELSSPLILPFTMYDFYVAVFEGFWGLGALAFLCTLRHGFSGF
jgi:hypothetical protein